MDIRLCAMLLGPALLGCAAFAAEGLTPAPRPVVGAIRWDAWFAGGRYERFLAPRQWHYRLPFYARVVSRDKVEVRSDTQEVMDREIAYAAGAGLDYWAFCYYHPKSFQTADSYNYGLRLYLASRRRADLNFCLILLQHVGPTDEWPGTVDRLVKLFKEPTYQKVLGGRPLLYVFGVDEIVARFGSREAAREALDRLRRRSVEAGLRSPYLVAQVFHAYRGAEHVDALGLDAVSAYSRPGGAGNEQHPYDELARTNRDFWNACKATGKQVIPIVNTGWDNRPRRGDPTIVQNPEGPWYEEPTPAQLAEHLRAALAWNGANPAYAEANAVLIYAWNESDEGGWLVPTLSESTARLDAVREVLRPGAAGGAQQ